jgi:two-component system chemotaxis sensor kinase CheA
MSEQDELLNDFLIESKETLDHLDEELLALENNPEDADLINAIFRRVHTIKGVCGFLDFHKLETVTHAGETLLQALRSNELKVTDRIITLLLTLCDAIRTIVKTVEETRAEGTQSYEQLAADLFAAAQPSTTSSASPEMSLDEEFEAILAQNEAAARAPESPMAVPPKPAMHAVASSPSPAMPEAPDATVSKQGAQETSLRIDVQLLDQLMNLAGELVLARNQILQSTKGFTDINFRAITQRLNLVTTELQEGVMKTRMQPINTVWGKFPRVVRDLSIACKKQVRLEMVGKETELDKTLIEAIKDPLTHIVRNSIDHGIELPEKRVATGKSAEGCITMSASQEGGYVIIEILDDGAGLNTEKIRDRALERGLITRERAQSMSEADIHRLIFAPGFSTADTVTNLSGRGVGMDVVKSSVEKIGGQVDISSRAGEGSAIKMKIPLTLAIIPALLLSCGNQKFAVPQSAIMELVQLQATKKSGALSWIGDYPFYKLREDLLPLLFLSTLLNVENQSNDQEEKVIVVVDVDGCRFGVVVDAVHDTEEIVVKPLGRLLGSLSTYAGATILGDGQIALILDPIALAREAHIEQREAAAVAESLKSSEKSAAADSGQYLVVQVTADIRAAIPLDNVRRLEEFSEGEVERVGGSSVIQYRGSILPLVDVATALGRKKDPWSGGQVIVVGDDDGAVGLQVLGILDVSSSLSAIKPVQGKPGIKSYGVVQGKVITLLDVNYLLSRGLSASEITKETEQLAV